jgi:hypothetical protein
MACWRDSDDFEALDLTAVMVFVSGPQHLGAGPKLESNQFWRGLLDDRRRDNWARSPEDVAKLGLS